MENTLVKPMNRPAFGLQAFSNGKEVKPKPQPKTDDKILVKHENDQMVLILDDKKLKAVLEQVKKLGGDADSLSVMPKYKKFTTEGDRFTGYFLQYERIRNSKNELLDSILWYEANGDLFYHSSVVLVDECRNKGINHDRFFVGVYLGKPKGTYMKFDIRVKPMD